MKRVSCCPCLVYQPNKLCRPAKLNEFIRTYSHDERLRVDHPSRGGRSGRSDAVTQSQVSFMSCTSNRAPPASGSSSLHKTVPRHQQSSQRYSTWSPAPGVAGTGNKDIRRPISKSKHREMRVRKCASASFCLAKPKIGRSRPIPRPLVPHTLAAQWGAAEPS